MKNNFEPESESIMEAVLEWLPRIGALLTLAIGSAGFSKPTAITIGLFLLSSRL